MRNLLFPTVTIIALLILACGPTVKSVDVTPSFVTSTKASEPVGFTAVAKDASGNAVPDVTLKWSVSDASLATIDQTGRLTPVANGQVVVKATEEGGVTGQSLVTVHLVPPIADDAKIQADLVGQTFETRPTGMFHGRRTWNVEAGEVKEFVIKSRRTDSEQKTDEVIAQVRLVGADGTWVTGALRISYHLYDDGWKIEKIGREDPMSRWLDNEVPGRGGVY